MPPYAPLEDRFWAKVDKRSRHECWLWKAGLNGDGYGEIHSGPAEQRMLHEYTPENTWRGPRGRYCIRCRDRRNAVARSRRAFQLTA